MVCNSLKLKQVVGAKMAECHVTGKPALRLASSVVDHARQALIDAETCHLEVVEAALVLTRTVTIDVAMTTDSVALQVDAAAVLRQLKRTRTFLHQVRGTLRTTAPCHQTTSKS